MSDIFSAVDPSTIDYSGDLTDVAAALPASLSTSSLPTFDLSSLFSPSTTSGAPIVSPPLNLPLPTVSGISGALQDITKLVTSVYAGEAQITAAQNAADLAKAKAQNALVTVKTTPNVWMVLGLGAAAIFALELVDRSK